MKNILFLAASLTAPLSPSLGAAAPALTVASPTVILDGIIDRGGCREEIQPTASVVLYAATRVSSGEEDNLGFPFAVRTQVPIQEIRNLAVMTRVFGRRRHTAIAIALMFSALSLYFVHRSLAQSFNPSLILAFVPSKADWPQQDGIINMHAKLPKKCDAPLDAAAMIHMYQYALYDVVNGPRSFGSDADANSKDYSSRDYSSSDDSNITIEMVNGHSKYFVLGESVNHLAQIQTCLYESIERFNRLAKQYKMRYSAHGGSAMGAVCSHSMNLWDDDIDVTVSSCDKMNDIYDESPDELYATFVDRGYVGDDLYKKVQAQTACYANDCHSRQ